MTKTNLIGAHERRSYTVEHRGNCILIDGAVPIGALAALTSLAPNNSVLSPDAARMLGVTFAIGLPDEIQSLIDAAAPAAERHAMVANPGLSESATRWLASGERGISSNTMFTVLTGYNASGNWHRYHPRESGDFRRCRLLLEAIPDLVPLFPKMGVVSRQWNGLVEKWAAICDCMDAEDPGWRVKSGKPLPKTYKLIKETIDW